MEHTNQMYIETIIAAENESKYHQIEGGNQPFSGELIIDLGRYGEVKYIQNIIDGTYTPPVNTNPATRDFLSACKYNTDDKVLVPYGGIVSRYRNQVKT